MKCLTAPANIRPQPTARPIRDTRAAGPFNFERAFFRSSNTYFIHYGHEGGIAENPGGGQTVSSRRKNRLSPSARKWRAMFPGRRRPASAARARARRTCASARKSPHAAANGRLIAAIANGGTIYWPRLVSHARVAGDRRRGGTRAPGRVRDHVQINPRTWNSSATPCWTTPSIRPTALGRAARLTRRFITRAGRRVWVISGSPARRARPR